MGKLGDVLKHYDQQDTLQHWGVKGMKWDEKFKKKGNELLEKVGVKESAADKAAKKEGFKNAKDKAEFDKIVKEKKLSPKRAAEFKAFMAAINNPKQHTHDFSEFAKRVGAIEVPKGSIKVKDKKKESVLDKILTKAFGKSEPKISINGVEQRRTKNGGLEPKDKKIRVAEKYREIAATNPAGAETYKISQMSKKEKEKLKKKTRDAWKKVPDAKWYE